MAPAGVPASQFYYLSPSAHPGVEQGSGSDYGSEYVSSASSTKTPTTFVRKSQSQSQNQSPDPNNEKVEALKHTMLVSGTFLAARTSISSPVHQSHGDIDSETSTQVDPGSRFNIPAVTATPPLTSSATNTKISPTTTLNRPTVAASDPYLPVPGGGSMLEEMPESVVKSQTDANDNSNISTVLAASIDTRGSGSRSSVTGTTIPDLESRSLSGSWYDSRTITFTTCECECDWYCNRKTQSPPSNSASLNQNQNSHPRHSTPTDPTFPFQPYTLYPRILYPLPSPLNLYNPTPLQISPPTFLNPECFTYPYPHSYPYSTSSNPNPNSNFTMGNPELWAPYALGLFSRLEYEYKYLPVAYKALLWFLLAGILSWTGIFYFVNIPPRRRETTSLSRVNRKQQNTAMQRAGAGDEGEGRERVGWYERFLPLWMKSWISASSSWGRKRNMDKKKPINKPSGYIWIPSREGGNEDGALSTGTFDSVSTSAIELRVCKPAVGVNVNMNSVTEEAGPSSTWAAGSGSGRLLSPRRTMDAITAAGKKAVRDHRTSKINSSSSMSIISLTTSAPTAPPNLENFSGFSHQPLATTSPTTSASNSISVPLLRRPRSQRCHSSSSSSLSSQSPSPSPSRASASVSASPTNPFLLPPPSPRLPPSSPDWQTQHSFFLANNAPPTSTPYLTPTLSASSLTSSTSTYSFPTLDPEELEAQTPVSELRTGNGRARSVFAPYMNRGRKRDLDRGRDANGGIYGSGDGARGRGDGSGGEGWLVRVDGAVSHFVDRVVRWTEEEEGEEVLPVAN